MRRLVAFALTVLALFGAAPGGAQDNPSTALGQLQPGAVISTVLTLDRDRLFNGSAFGQRVAREDSARLAQLAIENRNIEAALAAEEEELTKQRSETDAEAFRVLADAFDEKVRQTEQAQLAKQNDLNKLLEQEQNTFLAAAVPILEQLMLQSGAAVILEQRLVFIGVSQVDITDRAIALLDETIGDGTTPD